MKTLLKVTLLSLFLLLGSVSIANSQDTTRTSPFHLSFITPIGTNGLQSWNTTNLISINLFAGFSGGLKGVEVAGFANALKGDMNGIQMAGFCNNTLGLTNGIELAGFWNFNKGKVNGLLLSGFANVALDTVAGLQGAGYANYAHGSANTQLSGFANVTTGDVTGVQASGFANVTTGTQKGLQASGFFNYARKLRGVQVGVVNVADTVEKGIPVGFLSFVKNGYKVIQIGGNETLYGEISFKTGVRQFYNILAVGASRKGGSIKWGYGYGIGTLIPLGKRMDLSLEAVSYQINEDSWYTDHMNMLNRFNLSLSYNFTRAIGIYAGGSWNVMVTGNEITDEYPHHWKSDVSMYPGFNAGVRIAF